MTVLPTSLDDNRYKDPKWRLNNLYWITNKRGVKQKFKLNWAQEHLYHNLWYCNVILKARQLGISTYAILMLLDTCLFNSHKSAGIIGHTQKDAQVLFKRIKFAYDSLPAEVKKARPTVSDSATELAFSNGSVIRVGTSMRGSTLQYLHISEFGKICAKYPDKAEEIITGCLNAIAPGQYVIIESTAEGREGYFYDMCKRAQALHDQRKDLTELDFKFHFFPWHQEPSYRIGSEIGLSQEALDYFTSLEARNIHLDSQQKYWYAHKMLEQKDNMMREFPSTADEAWEQSNEGAYYGRQIVQARLEGRIDFVPYDPELPVHTAWDLGYNDSTTIWFVQLYRKEIRLIDYVHGSGESLTRWLGVLKSKSYTYGYHLAPHDIMVHEYTTGISRLESARKLGVNFIAVPKVDIIPGIDKGRDLMHRCWFDENKCALGLKALEAYRKDWDDRHGCWMSKPLHNWASHGADAFRTFATGLHIITGSENTTTERTLGYNPHQGRHPLAYR